MVSAHASTELATAALSAGALDCLDKTRVTETGLRRAVRTALEKQPAAAQIEAQRLEVAEQARRTRQILERDHRRLLRAGSVVALHLRQPGRRADVRPQAGQPARRAASQTCSPTWWLDAATQGWPGRCECGEPSPSRRATSRARRLAGAARLPGCRGALGLLPRRDRPQAGRGRARASACAGRDAAARGARVRGRGRPTRLVGSIAEEAVRLLGGRRMCWWRAGTQERSGDWRSFAAADGEAAEPSRRGPSWRSMR